MIFAQISIFCYVISVAFASFSDNDTHYEGL